MYIAIYWSGLWGSGGCAMGGVKYGVFSGLAVVLAEFAFWGGGGGGGGGGGRGYDSMHFGDFPEFPKM